MSLVYNKGIAEIMNGGIDLLTDTIKVGLVTSAYTANKDDDFWSTPEASELSGTGYTAGGKTLSSKAINLDDTNDRAEFDAGDVTWTAINAGTAAAAVIYKSTGTASTSPLIVHINTGGFPVATNGGDVTIQWNSEGIFYIG